MNHDARPEPASGVGSLGELQPDASELGGVRNVESAAPSSERPGVLELAAAGTPQRDRIYIAGPMTGMPDLNYPEFNRVARQLRALGYHVENPAENPDPGCGTWEAYMRMAIAQLVTCGEIHMLRGWRGSRGARIEHRLAVELGLVISGASA